MRIDVSIESTCAEVLCKDDWRIAYTTDVILEQPWLQYATHHCPAHEEAMISRPFFRFPPATYLCALYALSCWQCHQIHSMWWNRRRLSHSNNNIGLDNWSSQRSILHFPSQLSHSCVPRQNYISTVFVSQYLIELTGFTSVLLSCVCYRDVWPEQRKRAAWSHLSAFAPQRVNAGTLKILSECIFLPWINKKWLGNVPCSQLKARSQRLDKCAPVSHAKEGRQLL